MDTMDKVPATLEGVEAYARAHGLKFGFGRDVFTATRVIVQPFQRLQQMRGMAESMKRLNNPVDGTSNRHHGVVVVVARDGWNDLAYAVALHEFGHVLSAGQQHSGDESVHDEIDAWAWARVHAEHWSPVMDKDRAFALRSYTDVLGTYGLDASDRAELARAMAAAQAASDAR